MRITISTTTAYDDTPRCQEHADDALAAAVADVMVSRVSLRIVVRPV